MSKDLIVSAAIAAIGTGQAQVLVDAIGAACDASALEQKASDGTLSQDDLDKAVAAAVAAAQAVDAQALADAVAAIKTAADAHDAELQAQIDAITAKDVVDAAQAAKVTALQDSFAALQAAVVALAPFVPPPVV